MLKYLGYAITFAEFPDEIALCLNITNCPNHCKGCSEPWLAEDAGTELTEEVIDSLFDDFPDFSVFGLMGGDADHEDVKRIADYVHKKGKKIGFYSGQDDLDLSLIPYLDYYKVGHWDYSCGPLSDEKTNQKMYLINNKEIEDITYKFRRSVMKSHII